jgi:hypothetical protein
MFILLLCEARSGSTNLANWFKQYENFTVVQEPLNEISIDYRHNQPANEWRYNTKHIIVKEIYWKVNRLTDLIKLADKVVLLYRENYTEQFESWLAAGRTNNWVNEWSYYENRFKANYTETSYFKNMKDEFNAFCAKNPNYLKISYEQLYYKNGIEDILKYLNMDELEIKNFPYGKRYRVTSDKKKTLI